MSDRRHHRFLAMARTAELVNGSGTPDEMLTALMDLAMTTVGAERGFIVLIDPDTGGLAWRIARGGEAELSRTLVQQVYQSEKPFFNLDVANDAAYQHLPSVREFGLRAIICVPLLVQGRRVGVIYLDNRIKSGAFEAEDMDFTVAFAHQAAIALDRAMVRDLQAQHAHAVQRAAVGTLAAGVAHEINNPLGTILVNAQMLALDEQRPEEKESLALIVEGARKAKSVVDRLLTWFRAGTDGELTRFDLLDAVRDIVALSQVPAEVVGEPCSVESSRSALAQILLAVLDNARRASDRVQVRVQAGQVEVEDWGSGIPAEDLPRVFDPFFTTRPPGSGQGLGLFVARSLAERLGHRLEIARTDGRGTVVRVTL